MLNLLQGLENVIMQQNLGKDNLSFINFQRCGNLGYSTTTIKNDLQTS